MPYLFCSVLLALMLLAGPAAAQQIQKTSKGSVKAKHGVYFAPDNCAPPSGKKLARRYSIKQLLDEHKIVGMSPTPVKPFSKLILNWNSTYDIFLFNDPKSLGGKYVFPAVYSPATISNRTDDALLKDSELCIGPPGITQNGDTVCINLFGHFVILTDKLDSVRSVMNSTTTLHNVDQSKLQIIIDKNATVEANGIVDHLIVTVPSNGTASLEKLVVTDLAEVNVFSNGSAKVNVNGVLKGKRWSPERLQWIGKPTQVDMIQLD